jgi:hypothetical protein
VYTCSIHHISISLKSILGYHYVITTVFGIEDSIGQLFLTIHDTVGQEQQIAITG